MESALALPLKSPKATAVSKTIDNAFLRYIQLKPKKGKWTKPIAVDKYLEGLSANEKKELAKCFTIIIKDGLGTPWFGDTKIVNLTFLPVSWFCSIGLIVLRDHVVLELGTVTMFFCSVTMLCSSLASLISFDQPCFFFVFHSSQFVLAWLIRAFVL